MRNFLYNYGAYILLAEIVAIPLLSIYFLDKLGKKLWIFNVFIGIGIIAATCVTLKMEGIPGF